MTDPTTDDDPARPWKEWPGIRGVGILEGAWIDVRLRDGTTVIGTSANRVDWESVEGYRQSASVAPRIHRVPNDLAHLRAQIDPIDVSSNGSDDGLRVLNMGMVIAALAGLTVIGSFGWAGYLIWRHLSGSAA